MKAFWFEKTGDLEGESEQDHSKNITVDFKTTKTPPHHELHKPFEGDIYNLIGNIHFRKVNDPVLREMGEQVENIKNSDNIFISSDKTGNMYKITTSEFRLQKADA